MMVIQSREVTPDWSAGGDAEKAAHCTRFTITGPEDDVFFWDALEALPICNGFTDEDVVCPFRDQCLRIALINNEEGVFGGMTHPQRKWIRRNIPRDRWMNAEFLREIVPGIDYFKDLGNQTEEDERG